MNNCSDSFEYFTINNKCDNSYYPDILINFTDSVMYINHKCIIQKRIDYNETKTILEASNNYYCKAQEPFKTYKRKGERKMETVKITEILGKEFKSLTTGNFKSKYGFEFETNKYDKIMLIQKWIEKFDKKSERRRKDH